MCKQILIAVTSIIIFAACNDKTAKTTTTDQSDTTSTTTENAKTVSPDQQSGTGALSGVWKQTHTQLDVNRNGTIDADEKNLGIDDVSAPVDFNFRGDGTCDYTLQMKFKGFYEVKKENGNDILYISQDIEGKPSADMRFKYRIVSLNNMEMVLGLAGGLNVVYKAA